MSHYTEVDQVLSSWAAVFIATSRGETATYRFIINGQGGGTWVLDLARAVLDRVERETDCTLELDSDVLLAIANGELNPQSAYLQGSLKFSGRPELGLALSALI